MDRGAALNCRVVHNWTEDTDNGVAEPEHEDAASDDAETAD